MNARFIFSILLTISNGVAFSQQFSLKGILSNADANTKVYLLKINTLSQLFSGSNLGVVDSSAVDIQGNFEFTNPDVIEENTFYRLNVINMAIHNPGAINMVGTNENFAFFLLNKHSRIELRTSTRQVSQKLVFTKTDKPNYLIYKLNSVRKKTTEMIDELVKRRNALNSDLPLYKDSLKAISAQLGEVENATNYYQDIMKFADTVSNSYVSLLGMSYLPDDTFHSFYLTMNDRYQKRIPGSKYAAQFNAALKGESAFLTVGSKAPDITLPDNKGKMIKLSDLKGKYILIDFWASWCHPCRMENVSYIKPLYDKYHDKGFTVLSISQDINKMAWLMAIKKDQTGEWNNVSDFKGQTSKVSEYYKISYLPYNYLIDAQGTIVARNLRGAELEKFITTHFK